MPRRDKPLRIFMPPLNICLHIIYLMYFESPLCFMPPRIVDLHVFYALMEFLPQCLSCLHKHSPMVKETLLYIFSVIYKLLTTNYHSSCVSQESGFHIYLLTQFSFTILMIPVVNLPTLGTVPSLEGDVRILVLAGSSYSLNIDKDNIILQSDFCGLD